MHMHSQVVMMRGLTGNTPGIINNFVLFVVSEPGVGK